MNAMTRIRKALSATQSEIAEIVGRDQSTVSRWERGLDSPRLDEVEKLRGVFAAKGIPWSDDLLFAQPSSGPEAAA